MRFLVLIALCTVLVSAASLSASEPEVFSGAIAMVDGDTLRVGVSPNLRLLGIDAAEQDQTCETAEQLTFACGQWVTRKVRSTFDGRHATCESRREDRYRRPLVICWMNGEDLGARLVREGLARTYRDDRRYADEQKAAFVAGLGLWAVSMQDPALFRDARVTGRIPPDPSCVIKGNISRNGRIYHQPGDQSYSRTGIRPETGERWFCSGAEAEAAGWRRAKR